MVKTIISLPPEADLVSKTGWRRLDKNVYRAERHLVLVVKSRLDEPSNGPSVYSATYPAGTKYTFSSKDVFASKQTASVQRTVELTLADKLSAELLAKHSFGANVSATGPTISFGGEASHKISSELSTAVKDALSITNAFEIQNIKEVTRSIEVHDGAVDLGGGSFDLHLYLKLYEWHLDFYLVRVDQLTLEYRPKWFGLLAPIRRKVSSVSDPKALALFRLRLYEPIEGLSLAKGPYKPTISFDDSMSVHVEPLDDPAPPYSVNGISALEKLAILAFPKTAEERRIAARKAAPTKVAATKKGAGKRVAAKKTAVKKTAVKKTAAKKPAAKKAAAKKALRR